MNNEILEVPSKMRVLAIEDNRDFAQIFRYMLEAMGCNLDVAFDGKSGLELAQKNRPDIIFCDIGLPGEMDGFAFARAIRADRDLAHIHLIAVSGYTSDADRDRAFDAGFNHVFPKPVKFIDVSMALAAFSKSKNTGG